MKRYFGTDGIRGRVGEDPITPEGVMKLGWAMGQVLADTPESKVVLGKDTRISGYLLESALQAGLSAAGVDVILLGPMPTPGIAYLTRTFRAQAGIVISASHNPYQDNGIKFFSPAGTKLPEAVEAAIEQALTEPLTTVSSAQLGKSYRIKDAAGRYIEFCKSTLPVNVDLSGLTLVLDCAHGATYHIAPLVFQELGADVIPMGCKPTGLNINAACGTTHPEALQEAVLAHQADLGIAFDGDGDRTLMVDHLGEIVDGDQLLYIIVQHAQSQPLFTGGVVGTVMSNFGLEKALEAMKLPFARTKVGDRHVHAELQRRGWLYGGETSGHIITLDKTTTGDGIVSALQVLSAMLQMGERLHEIKRGMQKFPQQIVNVDLPKMIELTEHDALNDAVQAAEQQLAGTGRVVLRPSGTEPVIRVMVEGEDQTQVSEIVNELAQTVERYIHAHCSL